MSWLRSPSIDCVGAGSSRFATAFSTDNQRCMQVPESAPAAQAQGRSKGHYGLGLLHGGGVQPACKSSTVNSKVGLVLIMVGSL